jgi:uncharacterized protein
VFPGAVQQFENNTITVVGEATRAVVPDSVDVTVGVQSTAGTASQALRDNALRMQQLLQAATAHGLQQADIQTLGVSLYPLHPAAGLGPIPGLRPMGVGPFAAAPEMAPAAGYRVDNSLRLTVREPNRAGEVLDAVVGTGANLASNVAFRVRDDSAARKSVLEAAVKEARSKAEIMASAMGRQLGDASVAIEEEVPAWSLGRGLGQPLGGVMGTLAAPDPVTPVAAGELTYRARVRMRFAVR